MTPAQRETTTTGLSFILGINDQVLKQFQQTHVSHGNLCKEAFKYETNALQRISIATVWNISK